MTDDRVRVLYLAGSGRSGSTLITTILGQFDGAFAAGELRYLWRRGLVERRPCGCGRPLADCPWWARVLAELPDPDGAGVATRLAARLRMRGLPGLLHRRWRGRPAIAHHPDDVRLAALYAALARQAIRTTDRSPVIVDSSKLPPYGALLDGLPGIELRVLHVVRDPRATGWSWRRRRSLDGARTPADSRADESAASTAGAGGAGGRLMSRPPLWKASLLWLVWNATTVRLWGRQHRSGQHAVGQGLTGQDAAGPNAVGQDGADQDGGRYLRIRYEDFVAAPEQAIARITRFAGIDPAGSPFVGPDLVRLAPTHSVAGNPVRHRTGVVPVRPDDEWRSALGWRGYLVVTALTLPLLRRFGYPLRRGGARRGQRGED